MGYYTSYQNGITGSIFCDQTATVCTTFADPDHRTLCHELKVIQCAGGECPDAVINNGLILCTEDTGWNCNLCANDLPYNSPVAIDDTLYFQFQQQDFLNTYFTSPPSISYGWNTGGCNVYLKDCCTGEYLEQSPGVPKSLVTYCNQYFVGLFQSKNNSFTSFQGIKIPLANIYTDFKIQFPNSNCFYLEFRFELNNQIGDPNWIIETFYTETYEFVNCKNTLLISSDYTNKDCDGYWYGKYHTRYGVNLVLGNFFYYENQFRIPAYLERRNFQINKQFVGNFNRTVNSQMVENWKLLTERIPEKVALIIAKILSGSKIYIGNGEFTASGVINKNNDVGNQWFLDADISRTNCSKTFSCN